VTLDREARLSGQSASSDDARSEFQRDRDRVLYTAQFRRLSGITQVTTPNELYAFHNRLTHTLEVAQIARRIAERAIRDNPEASRWIDPDVCETAGLAHDLGHPPFGHNGERTLDLLSCGGLVEDGFEGNAQSLRILLKLAIRNSDEKGLDLTAATLRASVKYPWRRGDTRKFGVYTSEEPEFLRLWTGFPNHHRTVEAEIMDWSDDVAYSTHDFYDFALAGILPIHQLRNARGQDLKSLLEHLHSIKNVTDEAFDFIAQSFSLLPEQPLHAKSRFTARTVGMLKQWSSFLITRYASREIRFEVGSDGITLKKAEQIEEEIAILKAITYHFAIGSPALAVRHEGERRVLETLLEVLGNSAASTEKRFLSEDARERIVEGDSPGRVALDTISSMTDAQAISMFHKLTGVAPVSVTDTTTLSSL
jgi:dGTPase